MPQKKNVRMAVIGVEIDKREDGSHQITIPVFPMFHVVGATKSEALETAKEILKQHLEKNFNIKVWSMRWEDDFSDVHDFPVAVPPAHMIAELAV